MDTQQVQAVIEQNSKILEKAKEKISCLNEQIQELKEKLSENESKRCFKFMEQVYIVQNKQQDLEDWFFNDLPEVDVVILDVD